MCFDFATVKGQGSLLTIHQLLSSDTGLPTLTETLPHLRRLLPEMHTEKPPLPLDCFNTLLGRSTRGAGMLLRQGQSRRRPVEGARLFSRMAGSGAGHFQE